MQQRFILLIILVSILTFGFASAQNKITLTDIFNSSKFYGEEIQDFHWKKDGSGIIYREMNNYGLNSDFLNYDIHNDQKNVYLESTDFLIPDGFSDRNAVWSSDEKYILFTGILPSRDVKAGGNFFLYNIAKNTFRPVYNDKSLKMLGQFSPDSKYLGYVKDNNIFVADINELQEKQITFDGSNHIFNGHFDWVYEEEFDVIEGWKWSTDSKYIAYWQIDERKVPELEIPGFSGLYPKSTKQRYPKAGQKNSEIRIGTVNVESGEIQYFQFEEKDIYIPRIQWVPDGKNLAIVKLNRLQNHVELYLADILTGDLKKVFEETDNSWIEVRNDLIFLKLTNQFIWTSEKSGFRHIYLQNYQTRAGKQVTSGQWQIREIAGVDEPNEMIYFTCTKESEIENHLYRIDFNGNNLIKISQKKGWHDVVMSPDCKYYLDKFSDVDTPTRSILFDNNGNQITTLLENEISAIKDYNFGSPDFFKIPVDEVELNGWILKPNDFDAEKEYPLLIYTYGGPGSQKVKNEWRTVSSWFRFLVQNGIIVACVDNRGADGRGAEFKKYVYKKLGQLDVADQIKAAEYLAQLNYVDSERIGMYGWSYGGYMAAMCLLQGNEVFKLAVSVAPVTDWRYYDTIYTEAFMQTPELNKEGYKLGSVMHYADLLKGKLLLIHGMADNNVHFQNSAELVKALVGFDKQFDCMFYPGSKHSIFGKRDHVFTKITNFILENL